MITAEQNAKLTEVGPGTPMGHLLRRYWHPVAHEADLIEKPARRVTLLGEKLVLFRTEQGGFGLVQEACPHRGASLYYGFLEPKGIRCAYHGWLFDVVGRCLEQPFERKGFADKIGLRAYPVEELGGLLFAYLGPPENRKSLPSWDILVRRDGTRHFETQPDLHCNWLQIQENAVDVTHTFYLHAEMLRRRGFADNSGFGRKMKQYGFQPFPWGILKSWKYAGDDGEGWGNPLIFPNALRLETEMHWRVPLDDETTRIFWVDFHSDAAGKPTKRPGAVTPQQPRLDASGDYRLDTFMSQDAMAWETAGVVFDRSREKLGSSDIGISMFRSMLWDALNAVASGGLLPAQVALDSADRTIDLREWMNGYLPMSCPPDPTPVRRRTKAEVFDVRHKFVRLPEF